MPNLLVRGGDDQVIHALKKQAARHHRSTKTGFQTTADQPLNTTRRKPLAQELAVMPNVGQDSDFARVEDVSNTR